MKDRTEALRGRRFVGVAELAAEAARLLAEAGPAQERATVTELPDERMVRYYITEGLVTPAEEKQGTASVFGYLQLLQLLAVKNLQAAHLPIRKIRELVAGRGERELERLLGLERRAKNSAMSYLESLLTAPRASPPPPPPMLSSAPPPPLSRAARTSVPPPLLPSAAPATTTAVGTWQRVELEPGLELHVHSNYQPPVEAKGLRRLTQLITDALWAHLRTSSGRKGK